MFREFIFGLDPCLQNSSIYVFKYMAVCSKYSKQMGYNIKLGGWCWVFWQSGDANSFRVRKVGAKFVFHTDCTAGPLLCQWEWEQARTKLPTADTVFSLYNHHFSSNTNIGPFLCHCYHNIQFPTILAMYLYVRSTAH